MRQEQIALPEGWIDSLGRSKSKERIREITVLKEGSILEELPAREGRARATSAGARGRSGRERRTLSVGEGKSAHLCGRLPTSPGFEGQGRAAGGMCEDSPRHKARRLSVARLVCLCRFARRGVAFLGAQESGFKIQQVGSKQMAAGWGKRIIHNSEFEIALAPVPSLYTLAPSPFFQRPPRAGRVVGIDLSQSQVNLLAGAKLPREPIFKVYSQGLQIHAEAHLDQAIRYGKTLIKSRASGETPHKETIQPGNGAGARPLWTQ